MSNFIKFLIKIDDFVWLMLFLFAYWEFSRFDNFTIYEATEHNWYRPYNLLVYCVLITTYLPKIYIRYKIWKTVKESTKAINEIKSKIDDRPQ